MVLKRHARCRHLGGTALNHECDAGVDINDLSGVTRDRFTIFTVPCWGKKEGGCEHYSPYTEEEFKEMDRESAELFSRTIKARAAIVSEIERHRIPDRQDYDGTIRCPVCETGTLMFRRAGCNGHIWAKCTSDNCVAWIE